MEDAVESERFLGYGRQCLRPEDLAAVQRVLEGDWLTQGPDVPAFEAGLARFAESIAESIAESEPASAVARPSVHAAAVANGTLALQLAYAALDLGPGKRLVTTANTFVATAAAALRLGAEVEFLDVESGSDNLDLDLLEARLARGPAVDVVVPVHFAGRPVDMERLLALRTAHGFEIVEDAAHALGATWSAGGRSWHPGSHPEVAAATLSFHPVKHVTTGEGGAVLSARPELVERVARLRSHGIDRDALAGPAETGGVHPAPPWYAPMVELGFNARLSDLQAALGASQLPRLPDMLARRRELAERYNRTLPAHPWLRRPELVPGHAWHLYVVHVPAEERDDLMGFLRGRSIGTQVHYWPVPANPFFRSRNPEWRAERDVPHALHHGCTALSIPLYPDLTDADQDRVVAALAEWSGER